MTNSFETPGSPTSKGDTKMKKHIQSGPEIFKKFFDMGSEGKINMDLFVENGIYSAEEVANDKERVRNFKAGPEYVKPTNASIVLENMIDGLNEKNHWFCDPKKESGGYSVQLSEFDDTMKDAARADMSLEIRKPDGEIIHIIIDVTTSADYHTHYDKRVKCLEKIKKGQLHSIKYFQSQITNEMGRADGIPLVVAGIDEKSLEEFCKRVGMQEDLSNDPVVFMLLDEIVEQLNEFSSASMVENGADHAVTKKLIKTRDFFVDMLKKKNSLRPKGFREKADGDRTYSNIMKP